MSEQIARVVERSHTEEDIRHACNKLLDDFIEKAGLDIIGPPSSFTIGSPHSWVRRRAAKSKPYDSHTPQWRPAIRIDDCHTVDHSPPW